MILTCPGQAKENASNQKENILLYSIFNPTFPAINNSRHFNPFYYLFYNMFVLPCFPLLEINQFSTQWF